MSNLYRGTKHIKFDLNDTKFFGKNGHLSLIYKLCSKMPLF